MRIPKELKQEQICVIFDTREQLPLSFEPMQQISGTLTTGDYSVLGLTNRVALERKSLQDFIGCVGQHRERFDKEVKRLMAYEVRGIFIEASADDVRAKIYRGQIHPNAAMSAVAGWAAYGVPVHWCGSREGCQDAIKRTIYIACKRYWREMIPYMESVLTA